MAWLLFMDESGQDHGTYCRWRFVVVFAIHASKNLEFFCKIFISKKKNVFGVRLAEHGVEN